MKLQNQKINSMFQFATLANGVNKEQGLEAMIKGFSEHWNGKKNEPWVERNLT